MPKLPNVEEFAKSAARKMAYDAAVEVEKRGVELKRGAESTEWKALVAAAVVVFVNPLLARFGIAIPEDFVYGLLGLAASYITSRTVLKAKALGK